MENMEILGIVEKIKGIKETGNKYYKSENDILERKKTMYYKTEEGREGIMTDPYKANNTLASGWFKMLIDQKLNFTFGNPFNIDVAEIDKSMGYAISNIGKEASKNSIGWGYVYVEDNQLKLKALPFNSVYPVYENEEYGTLEKVYRYYLIDEKQYFEEITKDKVIKYIKGETGTYELVSELPHIISGLRYGNNIENLVGKGWGNVPIIPMYNNEEHISDLHNIKKFIDIYDVVESDFANNLEDIQDAYWVIKGYNGNNTTELLNNIKQYRTARVGEGGDARLETQEIPHIAKNEMLNRIENDIFTYGMGFNTTKVGDGNATNYIIQMRLSNLKLKATEFEKQIQFFLYRLLPFINEFYNKNYTEEQSQIKFNREELINESELIETLIKLKGIISDRTLFEMIPYISDVDEEIKRLEEQNGIDLDLINAQSQLDAEEVERKVTEKVKADISKENKAKQTSDKIRGV